MSEKVKVSKEVAEALKTVLPNGNISACIEKHVKGWDYEPKLPLKKLSTEEFARCCLIGYVIEESPEEKLLSTYKLGDMEVEPCGACYQSGIRDTLNILDMKIKGINS
ncbi:hypothetical protein FJQ98_16155 [Lysinibacillus agricola]|uniref:Uncharacterized protein n=1 Tax=Lysinibacillus agricola TaxID=2590012 RepID=A0ABX7ALS7_9BACI|nr:MULTISPECIES: hypothetical protein [Lysinibacillus]KOS61524.1 hypothetical protein AN161_18215 [Lysinibacillus sp. FJAT-14222]QQP10779.1 hypothetical protein FJQ98_16155 [Lysinibacillus agricola]